MGKILRNQSLDVLAEEVPEPGICGNSESTSSHIDAPEPSCRIRNSVSYVGLDAMLMSLSVLATPAIRGRRERMASSEVAFQPVFHHPISMATPLDYGPFTH